MSARESYAVMQALQAHLSGGITQTAAARQFGVALSSVNRAKKRHIQRQKKQNKEPKNEAI